MLRKFLRPIMPLLRWIKRGGKPIARDTRTMLRMEIAARYLRGQGLEIGALHMPLPPPRNIHVRYVDRMSVADLRKHYPELHGYQLVDVDVIDNGEELFSIPTASVDFVIANHLIEHTQDPTRSLENWLRVIRPQGVLYLAVPHKLQTFDRERPVTSLEHLIRDYREGTEWSRFGHFEEYVRMVEKVPENQIEARARELMEQDYSIHFHVWTETAFLEYLLHCQNHFGLPFAIELFQMNEIEFVLILRKL